MEKLETKEQAHNVKDRFNIEKLDYTQYMDPSTLNQFAAQLYYDEMETHDDERHVMTDTLRVLENVITALDGICGLEESMDAIMHLLEYDYEMNISEQDRMLLRVIAYNKHRRTMECYIAKAKEYTQKYSLEISEEKKLKEQILGFKKLNDMAVYAAQNGTMECELSSLMPVNPYEEPTLKQAWDAGYKLGEIYELWRNNL